MNEIAISTNGLQKQFRLYGGKVNTAVDDVNLQVNRGEIFGLIGPDGAGKTTLTRLILGLMTPTKGSASIFGFDSMRDPYRIRERIGYVAQQFTISPELTVMENMRFFADAQSIPYDQQTGKIKELLDFSGLTDFPNRITKRLSGGMKKKLALACSLIHEPDLVALDEPTLGVDPVSRREFWALLSLLRAEKGMTIFVCTPYMDEAERCERIGLMYKGRIIIDAPPTEIKKKVSGDLLEIHPEPGKFNEAMTAVQKMDGVLEVQTYGALVHVFVDGAEQRKNEIKSQLNEKGILLEDGIRKIEPRMEEVFISLVNRQESTREVS